MLGIFHGPQKMFFLYPACLISIYAFTNHDHILSLVTREHTPMKMLTYVMKISAGIPVRNI